MKQPIHIIRILLLLLLACSRGAAQDNPGRARRDKESYNEEIGVLERQKLNVDEKVAMELDAKKRNQLEQLSATITELIDWRTKERDAAGRARKKEYRNNGDEARQRMVELWGEIERANQKPEAPPPTPTPTPYPDTYETESGFRVRLRMTE